MLFKDLKPKTARLFWVCGAISDSLVIASVVAWLLLEGDARQVALIVMLSAVPTFLPLSVFFHWMASRPARYQSLLRGGQRGTATVRDAHLTRTRINAMPVLKLDLEVNVPGHAPYRAQDRVLAYPGSIQKDAMFECVVDPGNPQRVALINFDADVSVLAEGTA